VQATVRYFTSPVVSEATGRPTGDSADTHVASPTRRFPSWMWDLALASLIAGLATVEIIGAHPSSGGPQFAPTHLWAWVLRIGCCLTLVFRRRFPTMSLAVIWMLGTALAVGDYEVGVVIFAPWIAVYTVASCATPRRLVGAVIGTYMAVAVIAWSEPPDLTVPGAVWIGVLFTATAIAGHVAQRDRTRRTTDLAEREDAADARSRRARLVIATERLRIADELSTIIARSINTIAREAGAGSQAVDIDPVAARKTLEAISAISRDALNDLRRLLKRMRTENELAMYAPAESTLAVAAGAVT
jgi:signal transduction histidine kinase